MDREIGAQVAMIADTYIREHFPNWPAPGPAWKPEVLDAGAFWKFGYVLPPRATGGGPVVFVDKKSMKVVNAYHEQ